MGALDLQTLPLQGALGADHTGGALTPLRLPQWALRQAPDPTVALVASLPAGVRLALHTDATAIELEVDLRLLQMPGKDTLPAVFDLVLNGQLAASVSTVEGTVLSLDPSGQLTVTPGPTTCVRFELPGDVTAKTEIWLPHAAAVALRAVRVSAGARVTPADRVGPRWVHYGSSISHCLEALSPTQTWPNAVALRTGWDLQNLGLAGQCMLDPFVARVIRDLEADAISLKLGINVLNGDSFRERTFVPAVHGFLDTIREGHATTPIVLLTPIFFAGGEDLPGPTLPQADGRYATAARAPELSNGALTMKRIRELISLVAETRQDEHLHLHDGNALFGPDDIDDLYDALHPNAAGYLRMADRFFDQLCAPGKVFGSL